MTTHLGQEQAVLNDKYTVRPLRTGDENDMEALVRLYNEADLEYQIGLIGGRDLLEAGLRDKRQINTPNPLLVVEHPEAGDRFVGTLSLEPRLDLGRNLFFMHGLVHPAWTRRGVGVRLMQEALRLMRENELEPVVPELPGYIVFSVTGSMPHASELVREFGLEPERYFVTLYIDGQALKQVEMPPLPPNFSLRFFVPGRDEAEYTAAFNDSYFSNWGYSSVTVERVVHGWQHPPTDPTKLLLIWDDEANCIAAFARLRVKPETTRLHGGRGEVAWIGTRCGYQKQGLGRAVLLAALARLRDQYGFVGAAAIVDVPAANPEKTLHFFEKAGFHETIEKRITICRREI